MQSKKQNHEGYEGHNIFIMHLSYSSVSRILQIKASLKLNQSTLWLWSLVCFIACQCFAMCLASKDHTYTSSRNHKGKDARILDRLIQTHLKVVAESLIHHEECVLLCCNFTEVIFVDCPMKANMDAHVLASHAESHMSVVWQEKIPYFLIGVVADDVSALPN